MHFDMYTVLEIVLVTLVAFALYTVARRGIRSLEKKNTLTLQSASIITGVIKWAFIIGVTLTLLNIIGISAASIWTSLSAVLMLIALGFVAVWSILSNASCALFLVMFSPFRIGDEIEILSPGGNDPAMPGLRGKVIKISFVYTTLVETTPDGEEYRVHLPNNQLFQNAIRTRRGRNTSSLKSALFSQKDSKSAESPPVEPKAE